MSTPDITTVPGFRTDMTGAERVQLMNDHHTWVEIAAKAPTGTHCVKGGVEYEILKDPDTGLHFVFADRVKIGQTVTETAARIIRRNHANRTQAAAVTPRENEPLACGDHPHPLRSLT